MPRRTRPASISECVSQQETSAEATIHRFYDALSRRINFEIDLWKRSPLDPLPLSYAYRLLSFEIIKRAWIEDLLDLCRPNGNRFVFSWPPRDSEDNFIFSNFENVRPRLHQAVISELKEGSIRARGFTPDSVIKGDATTISADRWAILSGNFKNSTANLDGKIILHAITVDRAPRKLRAASAAQQQSKRARGPKTALRETIADRMFSDYEAGFDLFDNSATEESLVAKYGPCSRDTVRHARSLVEQKLQRQIPTINK